MIIFKKKTCFSNYLSKCKYNFFLEPMLNKTVSGDMAQDSRGIASISNLRSYTTYMVTIALITKHGEGLHSDPLLNTTLEGGITLRFYYIGFNLILPFVHLQ